MAAVKKKYCVGCHKRLVDYYEWRSGKCWMCTTTQPVVPWKKAR